MSSLKEAADAAVAALTSGEREVFEKRFGHLKDLKLKDLKPVQLIENSLRSEADSMMLASILLRHRDLWHAPVLKLGRGQRKSRRRAVSATRR